MKMRVYELAEKIKIPTKELIVFLKKEGIKVKNHMSTLDKDTIELITEIVDYEKEKKSGKKRQTQKILHVNKMLSLKELSIQLKVPLLEMMQKIIKYEKITSIEKEIPVNILETLAREYGYKVEYTEKLKEKKDHIKKQEKEKLITKSPVITIIGHVDHGKTTLLDAIRESKVTQKEVGGITQKIGAYQVEINGKKIVFLDTPGHEAFTTMRARGVKATDIAVLVVAADDGVMPQTIEAINHSKAADVPVIVAINKIDKANANAEKVKKELSNYELVSEEWGGDTLMVEVSALQKKGIKELLETIILQAEMMELKANPNIPAQGIIIETRLDRKRGIMGSVLIQEGKLHVGNYFISGLSQGKVRCLIDDKGKIIREADPSTPVEVTGFSKMPNAGDIFQVVPDEKFAKIIISERENEERLKTEKQKSKMSLDNLFMEMQQGKLDQLKIILKTDSQGSLDALKETIKKLATENEKINEVVEIDIIHSGVGNVTETDVMLASASNAIIIGFNIHPDANTQNFAKNENVEIRLYKIIYDLIDELEASLTGFLKPKLEEVVTGQAEVREIFKIPKIGTIAGSYVVNGKISKNDDVRIIREGKLVYEGKVASLKRFKEDVKEVNSGFECGIGVEKFNDIKLNDTLEFYKLKEAK